MLNRSGKGPVSFHFTVVGTWYSTSDDGPVALPVVSYLACSAPHPKSNTALGAREWFGLLRLSRTTQFLSRFTRRPSSRSDEFPQGQQRHRCSDDEQGDQVPSPSTDQSKVVLQRASIARMREVQLEERLEPVVRCPVVERVHCWFGILFGDRQVDRLIVGLGNYHVDVDQGGERQGR